MSGILGLSDFNRNISKEYESSLKIMANKLKKRDTDEFEYYTNENIYLGLTITDSKVESQSITIKYNGNTYVLIYDGNLYNKEDIKKELLENDFDFAGNSDAEVLLKAFICFGYDVCQKLNGIFSFAVWDEKKQELFLARDHFGIKPLYYTIVNGTLIFASEMKAILEFPEVTSQIDLEGISELIGLGPAHTPGKRSFQKHKRN